MTMASQQPSEEERRLLREYRLTSVPSRRSSCSPATSNASSSTTNNLSDQQFHQQPQIIASTTIITTATTGTQAAAPKQASGSNFSQTSPSHISERPPINCNLANNNKNNHLNNQNNHHRDHQPKHHSSNHRRHKANPQTCELSTEELNRMLELVSELSYLKLVTPENITINRSLRAATNGSDDSHIGNGRVMKPKNPSDDGDNQPTRRDVYTMTNGNNKSTTTTFARSCNDLSTTTSCKPYIFEKVDYIKKISIRRKAFRKLKKARIKSLVSPSATESPLIKTKDQ